MKSITVLQTEVLEYNQTSIFLCHRYVILGHRLGIMTYGKWANWHTYVILSTSVFVYGPLLDAS